ncbi:hypothetical protein ACF1A5_31510 [Streptomyces sp. NPDC014864]|uniref:hypothetical protein n=1 Tax=Streptomyces sp. NPDC014864 TaxID=3364924 RepID=UPI0036F65EEA
MADSSVGGPLLWPVDEPWPVCAESHSRARGRRPADIHRWRQVLASAWLREPNPGPTDAERRLLKELGQDHRVEEAAAADPLPLIGLAQFYRRDVPDLPAGPDDCDLLQVFWCPFDAHGPTGYRMLLDLRWRRSWEVAAVLASPPQPQVVGFEGYVPEPCVLHPEQVATYPFAGLLPQDLCARIDAWEEALEEEAEQPRAAVALRRGRPVGMGVGLEPAAARSHHHCALQACTCSSWTMTSPAALGRVPPGPEAGARAAGSRAVRSRSGRAWAGEVGLR